MRLVSRFHGAWIFTVPVALATLLSLRVPGPMSPLAISDHRIPISHPGPAPRPLSPPAPRPAVTLPVPPLGSGSFPLVLPRVVPIGVETAQSLGSAESTDQKIARAIALWQAGDTDEARHELQGLAADTDRTVAARALFLEGRIALESGDADSADRDFEQYLMRYPDGADAPLATFARGWLARQRGQPAAALTFFRRYLDSGGDLPLAGYALLAMADAAQADGDQATAITYRREAIAAGLPLEEELAAASAVGQNFESSRDYLGAAHWYQQLAERPANDPATRAHYAFLRATELQRAGQRTAAINLYRALLDGGDLGGDAPSAVRALAQLGSPLSDFEEGEAYLKAHRYTEAVAALGHYLDREPEGASAATARFDRARALLGAQSYVAAAQQFDRFLTTAPSDPRAGEAIILRGQALVQAGQLDQAVAGLRDFAVQHPADPAAPRALAAAVQALQNAGQDEQARAIEQILVQRFPGSAEGARAGFALGWDAYERLDFTAAKTAWEKVLAAAPRTSGSAPALLWLGKMEERAGNSDVAHQLYQMAWNANPGDYYAFRARELAGNATYDPQGPIRLPSKDELDRERGDFERWLAGWTHPDAASAALPYLGAPISRSSTLDRIRALIDIGLTDLARAEITSAMSRFADDGRSLYALADVLDQLGLTPESLAAAYRLLMISPAPNAYQAPLNLQRLVYPFPYRDLIVQSARQYGIDPLLLVALIRQESAFRTEARSSASAVGLTQFLPSTALGVAAQIGLADFDIADLTRPRTAIELGAAYLASQIKAFGGNPYIALAAYNAGAGNVRRWLSDNPRGDVDLFVEEIPYQETREYVRNIYRFYQEYVLLYRGPTG